MIEIVAWIMTGLSIIGTILNIKKLKICFLFWLPTNVFWIIYDIYKGAYPQAVVFAVYFGLAIYGIIEWGRHDKKK